MNDFPGYQQCDGPITGGGSDRGRLEIEKQLVDKKRYVGGDVAGQQCASETYTNPRRLIDQRIDFHNKMANRLHALLRALPAEMSPEAERGLVDILQAAATSNGRW